MNFLKEKINKFFYYLFDKIIGIYQLFISPLIPARCRYYPTCSAYGRQALAWHGAWRGSKLTFKRVCRCHPWGGHGVDFVPVPLYQYHYRYLQSPLQLPLSYRHYVYLPTSSYAARLSQLMNNSAWPC